MMIEDVVHEIFDGGFLIADLIRQNVPARDDPRDARTLRHREVPDSVLGHDGGAIFEAGFWTAGRHGGSS